MINRIFFLLLFSSSVALPSKALFHKRVPVPYSSLNSKVRSMSLDFPCISSVIELKALAYEIDTFINAYEMENNTTEMEELKSVLKHNVKVNLHFSLIGMEDQYFSELDLITYKTLKKIKKTKNISEIELLMQEGLEEIDEFNLPIQSCIDEDITPEKTAAYKEHLKNELRKIAVKMDRPVNFRSRGLLALVLTVCTALTLLIDKLIN